MHVCRAEAQVLDLANKLLEVSEQRRAAVQEAAELKCVLLNSQDEKAKVEQQRRAWLEVSCLTSWHAGDPARAGARRGPSM